MGLLGLDDGLPPKPKGMHWRIYRRLEQLRPVNQRSTQRNNKNIPHDQRAMDRAIPNLQIASRLAQSAMENQRQEYVMTTPTDNTLTAIGRQLSVACLPTVVEPLPRELKDLVAQLVGFEMRKRELSARPSETLQFVMARLSQGRRNLWTVGSGHG
jgi:hypothetical protein